MSDLDLTIRIRHTNHPEPVQAEHLFSSLLGGVGVAVAYLAEQWDNASDDGSVRVHAGTGDSRYPRAYEQLRKQKPYRTVPLKWA